MKIQIILTLLTFLAFTRVSAQMGQYDVRLSQEHVFYCTDDKIYFDIQIKASNAGTAFRLAEQNYRFDYDMSVLANPQIDQELDISGMIPDGIGTSVYGGHTLIGTLGPTVCYNIELIAGAGYLLTDSWVSVGRVAFDVLNPAGCMDLIWRTQTNFPITYIGVIDNTGGLSIASEGVYTSFFDCLGSICQDCPLNLNLSYVVPDNLYQAEINVTSDGTVPDGGTVDYKAGTIICLDKGFVAEDQADFSAEIYNCRTGN